MNRTKELVQSSEDGSPIAFDAEVKAAVVAEIKKHLEVFSGIKTEF